MDGSWGKKTAFWTSKYKKKTKPKTKNKQQKNTHQMLLAAEAYNTKKTYKLNEKYVPLCILYLLND